MKDDEKGAQTKNEKTLEESRHSPFQSLQDYLRKGVQRFRNKTLSKSGGKFNSPLVKWIENFFKMFFKKVGRVFILAYRRFNEDQCDLLASALTFYSLLSIVPLLATFFGIAKGFGFEEGLEASLLRRFPEQEIIVKKSIEYANSMLIEARGGIIGGVGILVLLATAARLMNYIENGFNRIWHIKKSRSLGRMFSDYLSILLICPVLFMAASSLNVFLVGQIKGVSEKFAFLSTVQPIIIFWINLIPFALIWALFTITYLLTPNTKVSFRAAAIAGGIGGSFFQLWQWTYINFQIGVTKTSAIYGSFAALPLFLTWLQISWIIVLLGAEICVVLQNKDEETSFVESLQLDHYHFTLLGLLIAHRVIKNFEEENPPLTLTTLGRQLELPKTLLTEVMGKLVKGGIISEIALNKESKTEEYGYQPARPLEKMRISSVMEAFDKEKDYKYKKSSLYSLLKEEPLNKVMRKIYYLIEQSDENKLLKDI